jgi:hypothetical protein
MSLRQLVALALEIKFSEEHSASFFTLDCRLKKDVTDVLEEYASSIIRIYTVPG